MPFKNISEAIKKHPNLEKYSDKAKDAWLSAFNSAWDRKQDEGYAFATAYSVANKIDKKSSIIIDNDKIINNIVDFYFSKIKDNRYG